MADTTMSEPPKSPPAYTTDPNEPLYGGYTRFELELEVLPPPPLPSPPHPNIPLTPSHPTN